MADSRNYQPWDQQLMEDLSRMFPEANTGMIREVLLRNNNHRERCVEDMLLSCAGHCNVSSDRYSFSGRSQSVSGDSRTPQGPSNNNNNNNNYQYQQREPTPQSAPVISDHDSPFSRIRLSFKNDQSGVGEPLASYTPIPPRFLHPTRPPVPPPTYRVYHQHELQGINHQNQQYPYVDNYFSPEQPRVRHKTSLHISPIRPPPLRPAAVNERFFPVPTLSQDISPSSLLRANSWGQLSREKRSSPTAPPPKAACQSELHISISPDGGCITASRSDSLTPPTLSYVKAGKVSPQSSPRVVPKIGNDGFQLSLVDMEDPEQKRVTHMPLKPAISPLPICGDSLHLFGDNFHWPAALIRQDYNGNNDCTSALITNQKHKLSDIKREVERIRLQNENEKRELKLLEFQYFTSKGISREHLYFTFKELQSLRDEVHLLMAGCNNMTTLVDLLHKGQVPLGETGDIFYENLNTGQHDPAFIQGGGSRPQPCPSKRKVRPAPAPPVSLRYQQEGDYACVAPVADSKWECCSCTFLNPIDSVKCEICTMPKFPQVCE